MLSVNAPPEPSTHFVNTFERETTRLPENNQYESDIYKELGLPKIPPAIPKLSSNDPYPTSQPSYTNPNSLIPDYKSIYNFNNIENTNPNLNPNQIFNPQ